MNTIENIDFLTKTKHAIKNKLQYWKIYQVKTQRRWNLNKKITPIVFYENCLKYHVKRVKLSYNFHAPYCTYAHVVPLMGFMSKNRVKHDLFN